MSARANHDALAEQARQVAKEIAVILSGTTTHGDGSSWVEKAERLIAREWMRAYRGGVQAAAQEASGEAQQHVRHRDESDGQDAVEHAACVNACRAVAGRIVALIPEGCP